MAGRPLLKGLRGSLEERIAATAEQLWLADALAAFLSEHGAILDDVESFVWWLERPDR